MKPVTAAEAGEEFSSLQQEAAEGETVVVAAHGRPFAPIVPAVEPGPNAARAAAVERLLEHLKSLPRRPALLWTREELYEDEPYPASFR